MVAEVDAPAAKVVTVGVHVHVRYVFAFDGLQLLTLMVRFSAMLPVFLSQMVTAVWPPGFKVPQVIADIGVVKPALL